MSVCDGISEFAFRIDSGNFDIVVGTCLFHWSQVDTVHYQSEWQQGMLSEYDKLTTWPGQGDRLRG